MRDNQARALMILTVRQLLEDLSEPHISTQAVCEAAGLGVPGLYRLFGEKSRLLSAIVDDGFN